MSDMGDNFQKAFFKRETMRRKEDRDIVRSRKWAHIWASAASLAFLAMLVFLLWFSFGARELSSGERADHLAGYPNSMSREVGPKFRNHRIKKADNWKGVRQSSPTGYPNYSSYGPGNLKYDKREPRWKAEENKTSHWSKYRPKGEQ